MSLASEMVHAEHPLFSRHLTPPPPLPDAAIFSIPWSRIRCGANSNTVKKAMVLRLTAVRTEPAGDVRQTSPHPLPLKTRKPLPRLPTRGDYCVSREVARGRTSSPRTVCLVSREGGGGGEQKRLCYRCSSGGMKSAMEATIEPLWNSMCVYILISI